MWYQTEKLKYRWELDAVRGIAAFLIFLYHYWMYYFTSTDKLLFLGLDLGIFFKAGHVAVSFFFVLSGFFIFLTLAKDGKIKKDYFKNRFLRIFPLAAFFILLTSFLRGSEFWLSDYGFKNIIYHLLFIQAFDIETYWGLHPAMWMLTVEALFYLVFPFIFIISKGKKWHFLTVISILTILSFIYRIYVFQKFGSDWSWENQELIKDYVFLSEQLWGRFADFAAGIFLAVFYLEKTKKENNTDDEKSKLHIKKKNYFNTDTILFIGLIGLIFLIIFFSHIGGNFRRYLFLQSFLYFLVSVFFTLFLAGLIFSKKEKLKKIILPKFFVYIGKISYSFYLWHFAIIFFLYKGVLPGIFPWKTEPINFHPAFVFFASLILSIAFSHLTYKLIEKPFLRMKK